MGQRDDIFIIYCNLYIIIYFACLSVFLIMSLRLYPINVKTAEPIGPNIINFFLLFYIVPAEGPGVAREKNFFKKIIKFLLRKTPLGNP